ncbi:MAG TPA: hypothetical protein VGT44_02180 [Ktedonobacteraceae bacterium]|nr:hypothetical protein [Ktedonobacteraceae bacterium]
MVPQELTNFFTVSAGVGATLIGLIFVAVSIAPERTVMEGAPLERQAVATSAFSALVNAFFISLIALIPGSGFVITTLTMSIIGLSGISLPAWSLLKHPGGWRAFIRNFTALLVSVVLYVYELFQAIALLQQSADSAAVYTLAVLISVAYALGLLRSWQLLGARRFRLSNLLVPSKDAGAQKSDAEQAVGGT